MSHPIERYVMGRKFGYARVSSTGQNLDRQIVALKEYVDEESEKDLYSGIVKS